MWARHAELALGLWVAATPFVFEFDPGMTIRWAHPFGIASVLVSTALLTHWQPLRRLHLLLLPVATWLLAFGWWQAMAWGPRPSFQNWIVVGLLLGMFAIVPSQANRPPRPWQEWRGSDDR